MKRIVGLLLFLCAFATHGQGYFTGAWWQTKVPKTEIKWAGQIDVILYDDGSLDADIFHDGFLEWRGGGTWILKNGEYTVTFSMNVPEVINFTGKTRGDFIAGKFSSATKSRAGKWQGSFVATDEAKTTPRK